MRAKFGADDVTSPSKRFAFDGLKLICKKKTSSYKNWLLRCKEVAHKHRQRFFKFTELASLFIYHRQRWFFVSARSGKLFYIWRYLISTFLKLVLAIILPLKCKKGLNVVILLSKCDSNCESPNKLESCHPFWFLHQTIEEAEETLVETKHIQKLLSEIRSNTSRSIELRPHIGKSL